MTTPAPASPELAAPMHQPAAPPAPSVAAPAPPPLGLAECSLLAVIFAALLALRLVLIFHWRVDSDEPQHLHVAWGWAHGMVQYRDFFDNHTPLFHLLMSPFVALIGDRANIVLLMRLVMLVPYAVMLGAFYRLVRGFFGRRAGWWATAALALYPAFFIASIEFRTDELWAACWMLTLLALLGGPWSRRRALAGGLLFGVTLGASMKTILMIGSLGGALALLPLASPQFRRAFSWRALARHAALFLGGFACVPALLAALIAALGAWPKFVYCTIRHNLVESKGLRYLPWWHLPHNVMLYLRHLPPDARRDVAIFTAGVLAARRLATVLSGTAMAIQATFLCLAASVAWLLLTLFWPVVQVQTEIPFFPLFLFVLLILPLLPLRRWPDALPPALRRLPRWIVPVLGAALAAFTFHDTIARTQPLTDNAAMHTRLVADARRLTAPGETLLDSKGETVLRRRPYYYVLERFTMARLGQGSIPDTIAHDALNAKTCVAVTQQGRFPPKARRFLRYNFLAVGPLSVAGKVLRPDAKGDPRVYDFDLAIPTRYSLVTPKGAVKGMLDGHPCAGPAELGAGHHHFVAEHAAGAVTLIWTRALERGFSPFKPGRLIWAEKDNA